MENEYEKVILESFKDEKSSRKITKNKVMSS